MTECEKCGKETCICDNVKFSPRSTKIDTYSIEDEKVEEDNLFKTVKEQIEEEEE